MDSGVGGCSEPTGLCLRLRGGIKFLGKGVWSQTELHQALGLGKTRRGEPVVALITSHCLTRRFVPTAGGFMIQVSGLD